MSGAEAAGSGSFAPRRVAEWLRAAVPAVLYGLRVAASVCIALGVAYALELDEPYWAGTTAAIVCQPILGSSLRKAFFRSIGTVVGAVAAVVLVACFPQDRIGFVLGIAGWCAMCGFVGTRLTFFAAYGAMLAGYTAVIIATSAIDSPDGAFMTALFRITEIGLGIAVATAVLAATQIGSRREQLARALGRLAADVVAGLVAALAPDGEGRAPPDSSALLGRLAALEPMIDQVTGEAAHWRFRVGPVRAAQDGLFAGIAGIQHLQSPAEAGERAGRALWQALPPQLRHSPQPLDPAQLLSACRDAMRALAALPARDAPARRAALLADALSGAVAALEVVAWLTDPDRPAPAMGAGCPAPQDPLPALVNAARVFAAVVAAAALWIETRWSGGQATMLWAAIPVLLMSPQGEAASRAAASFAYGSLLAAGIAAVVKFAVLPQLQDFWALSLALGSVLVPLAALSTVARLSPVLVPASMNFVALLSLSNEISYDTEAFYNSTLTIVAGAAIGCIALRVIASAPASVRVRRLLDAAEADCASVRSGAWRPTAAGWRDRMRTRTGSLPAGTDAAAFLRLLALFRLGADAINGRDAAARGGAG